MIKFSLLDKDMDHNCAIFKAWIVQRPNGVVYRTPAGKVLVFHGSPDGTFGGMAKYLRQYVERNNIRFVVCCHPAAHRRENPDLPILGNWEGTTECYLSSQAGDITKVDLVVKPA